MNAESLKVLWNNSRDVFDGKQVLVGKSVKDDSVFTLKADLIQQAN